MIALQYNRDFQVRLLTNLMADPKFFAEAVQAMHITDFDLPACRFVFEVVRGYYLRHKTLPPDNILTMEAEHALCGLTGPYETMLQPAEYESLAFVLGTVVHKSPADLALPYFKENLIPYLKHVRVAQARAAADADPEALMRDLVKINDDLSRVTTDDIAFANAMDPLPVSSSTGPRSGTGVHAIDRFINGGLEPKQMGMLVACTGVGKTCGLVNFAVNTALLHRYGLFITLELPASKIIERYQGILAHFDASMFVSKRELWTPDALWRMEYAMSPEFPYKNNIKVFDASIKATSVPEIEKIIIKWKHKMVEEMGVPEDQCMVVYVDWLEKISSEGVRGINKSSNDAMVFKLILEALGEVARRHNIVIWTATQATRAAVGREVLNITHTAHSVHAHDPLDLSIGLAAIMNGTSGVDAAEPDTVNEDTWRRGPSNSKRDTTPPCNRMMNASFFKTRYSAASGKVTRFYQGPTLRFWDFESQHQFCTRLSSGSSREEVRQNMAKIYAEMALSIKPR